jgi:hypothetical protein
MLAKVYADFILLLTYKKFYYILINVLTSGQVNDDSLAQLGERYLDRVEVAGSNPVGIILFPLAQIRGRKTIISQPMGCGVIVFFLY